MELNNVKEIFDKYVQNYDLNIESIKGKYYHSYRVADISKAIAKNLNFTNEEIELAIVIGLLHDIARFEQWTRYETFDDLISIDHGDLGVEILKDNNFIRNFIKDDKYDEIILTAIKNHNKFEIESGVDEYTLKFCKLIRDADKIDILFLAIDEFYKKEKDKNEIQNSEISEKCYQQILNRKLISRKDRRYPLDKLLNTISFVYDFNFDYSKRYILEKDFVNRIFDLFDFSGNENKDKIEFIRKNVNEYLNN